MWGASQTSPYGSGVTFADHWPWAVNGMGQAAMTAR
jgi:hypothetical protein